MRNLSLGIDIGGTFSDVVIIDTASGDVFSHKELTTHDDPARGALAGIDAILQAHDLPANAIKRIVHATTLFTNALTERKGACTGLLTTEGFRDLIEIGRERRFELFDLNIRRPMPLVPRNLRRDIPERLDRRGTVITPLDLDAVLAEVGDLVAQGVTSIAIMFLHSYHDPTHEQMAAKAIQEKFPDLYVSCSHEITPVIRETERALTTVANAYVKPLANYYFDELTEGLKHRNIASPVQMMLSSGGLTSLEDVSRAPIKAVEAGPAAGVIAASLFGAEDNFSKLMAFDMGGTTAKLCVVENGTPMISYLFEAARQDRFLKGSGLPIRISTVELIEIGAGGGSIAHKDSVGLMKVGPESAGSTPGPASYGQGGTEPTVTDANFALGFLNPKGFAGGTIKIDRTLGKEAIQRLAGEMSLSDIRLAWGIYDVVNESMASAARVHIAEHGQDPRHFVLLGTGGGGPLHAYYVGKKLGVKKILCPAGSGVASAIGLLRAPASVDKMASVMLHIDDLDWTKVEEKFATLEAQAKATLSTTAKDIEPTVVQRSADMRIAGQAFELVVDLPGGPFNANSRETFEQVFAEQYRKKYAQSPNLDNLEIINIRASVTVDLGEAVNTQNKKCDAQTEVSPKETRAVYFPEFEKFVSTPIFDRHSLVPRETIKGPAIVEEPMSTIVVGPDGTFTLSPSGHVLIELS